MLHVTQVRRPAGSLRKPSLPKPSSKVPTNTDSTIEVNQDLQNRIAFLEDGQQDSLKEEIVGLLNGGLITASECLQLFINTAWKDRNTQPIISRIFHNITQETEADFSLLIDSKCNNLLKVLTVLGKPTTSDLLIVTLLANLYHINDLPVEHKEGLEMYLIDIAKAFWPYFIPEKNPSIWNDEICDCVCDVLISVGKILDVKCPINMERTFNNITTMMFSSCVISSYTLLRFLELKELRAANWCLTSTAKSYYKAAYSKHDRSSSYIESPGSQSSPKADDDIFYSQQYKVTISKDHIKNGLKRPVVVKVKELDYSVSQSVDNKICQSTENIVSQSYENIDSQSVDDKVTQTVDTKIPHSTDSKVSQNTAYGVTDSKDETDCNQVNNAVINNEDDEWSIEETDKDTCKDISFASCDDTSMNVTWENSQAYNKTQSETNQGSANNVGPADQSSLKGFPGNFCLSHTGTHSIVKTMEGNIGCSRPQGFPGTVTNSQVCFTSPYRSSSLKREIPENDSNGINHAECVRPYGFPGTNNHQGGFGSPGRNTSFHRSMSENDCRYISGAGQFGTQGLSEINHSQGGFPPAGNHFFRRAGNDDDSNTGDCNSQGGFHGTRHNSFQRAFSESDGSVNSGGFPRMQRQNSNERNWKCMLEFPVEVENENSEKDSRLYLLSFATRPVSLERPLDLIMTEEVKEQKPWLMGVILTKPKTVLERFNSLQYSSSPWE